MSCLSWRPATGACVTVLSTRLANGALRRRHRVLLERGSTAVLGGRGYAEGLDLGAIHRAALAEARDLVRSWLFDRSARPRAALDAFALASQRSEERRVGKECRSRWW